MYHSPQSSTPTAFQQTNTSSFLLFKPCEIFFWQFIPFCPMRVPANRSFEQQNYCDACIFTNIHYYPWFFTPAIFQNINTSPFLLFRPCEKIFDTLLGFAYARSSVPANRLLEHQKLLWRAHLHKHVLLSLFSNSHNLPTNKYFTISFYSDNANFFLVIYSALPYARSHKSPARTTLLLWRAHLYKHHFS